MAKLNKVCVNIDQSNSNNGGFTDAEKAQARTNIGAGTSNVKVKYSTYPAPVVTTDISEVQLKTNGKLSMDGNEVGMIVPTPTNNDKFKYLRVTSGLGLDYAQVIPDYTYNQAGKVLTVNHSNNNTYLDWNDVGTNISNVVFNTISINIPASEVGTPTSLINLFTIPAKTAFIGSLTGMCSISGTLLEIYLHHDDAWGILSSYKTNGGSSNVYYTIPFSYYNNLDTTTQIQMSIASGTSQQTRELSYNGILLSKL